MGGDHTPNHRALDQRTAAMIAQMTDADPPAGVTAAVMQRIQPKKPRTWQRIRRAVWVWPMIATPRLASAGAAVVLLAGGLILYRLLAAPAVVPLPLPGSAQTAGHTVILELDWPSAHKVAVVGSFNHWNPEGYLMQRKSPDGPWIVTLVLAEGRHAYAFLVDDHQVIQDPAALWQQEDGFGGRNSTLIVANGKTHENNL